jgi:hypothetical protein
MAKIIGYNETKAKRFTCYHCAAIVEYMPNEPKYDGRTDESTKIKGSLTAPAAVGFTKLIPDKYYVRFTSIRMGHKCWSC